MGRVSFKPGNMLYPLPAVLVSVGDGEGNTNLFTVAWTGTICSDPPMVSISVRKERYSYGLIEKSGQFVINLTTEALAYATDYCGVKSGRDVDKWKECKLTPIDSQKVLVPSVKESPVAIECEVVEKKELGTHHMFIARVVAVTVDDKYMNDKGTFMFSDSRPIVYSHGEYYNLGENIGKFGYSIRKK